MAIFHNLLMLALGARSQSIMTMLNWVIQLSSKIPVLSAFSFNEINYKFFVTYDAMEYHKNYDHS